MPMRFFDAVTRRFAVRIVLPAIIVLAATSSTVIVALSTMADDVNRIETTITGRSVSAALQAELRRFGASNKDYAEWDDAVRNLYGTASAAWAAENIASSTLFDTFYLVDDKGDTLLAFRKGEPTTLPADVAFGPALATMIKQLPSDGTSYGVATGFVRGAWGLATVAIGPVVPLSENYPDPPGRSRFLILAKAFDAAAVDRISQDFLIGGLRLADPSSDVALRNDIVDPGGTVVGALTWSPGHMGTEAKSGLDLSVLGTLALVGVTMLLLIASALAGWKEVQRRELSLDAALNNMVQGLCLFDGNSRLITVNRRFAEIFRLRPDQVVPGLSARQVFDLAVATVTDRDMALADQRRLIVDPESGPAHATLTDGRFISISHRPLESGGFVVTFEDTTERIRAEQRARHLSHNDALTDLPNRVTFYERLGAALGDVTPAESMAVLSLDLDRFKNVNDTLGNPVGDRVLQVAADRLRRSLREDDFVARLGSDEFAIVQAHVGTPADVSVLAARLIEVVGAPYELGNRQAIAGVSVGIAIAPGDGGDPDTLLKNADLALHRAKADGGGVFRFFELDMDARMQARRALEIDLRKAIIAGAFELAYQPIVDVGSGKVTTCEALIRWRHPERGIIAPLEFIPLAEETGLIVPIGEWALRRACTDAASWPDDVTVAVNVSPAQFKSRNFVSTIVNTLAASGLPASRLMLEITELVLLQENEGALAVLRQLRDLGIRIAMDDFGTGYSSLGYLRSFQFDKIKIDQSFIRDLTAKKDSVAIVRAVVGMASSLGMSTTAEGVETREQLAILAAEGCEEYQGFLFSAPRPVEEIAALLSPADAAAVAVA